MLAFVLVIKFGFRYNHFCLLSIPVLDSVPNCSINIVSGPPVSSLFPVLLSEAYR